MTWASSSIRTWSCALTCVRRLHAVLLHCECDNYAASVTLSRQPSSSRLSLLMVLCRLDYVYGTLVGLLVDCSRFRVQRPGSSSDSVVVDHITDAFISLHKLRVPERMMFKVAVPTYRLACRSYFGSSRPLLTPQDSVLHLRSSGPPAPAVKLSTVGRRAFPVAGARIWNDLASDVSHVTSSLSLFKS